MKGSAVLASLPSLTLGLAVLSACNSRMATLTPAAPPAPPAAVCGLPAITDGAVFVRDRVRVLRAFAFSQNGMVGSPLRYVPPTADPGPPPDPYRRDIAEAFDLAPRYLKLVLSRCVDTVFVDTVDQAPFGWSFWEVPGQGSGRRRYVALGDRLWRGNRGRPYDLSKLETVILNLLLGQPEQELQGPVRVGGTARRHKLSVAIVAVLAREAGLVLNHDFARHDTLCDGRTFWRQSWTGTLPSDRGMIHHLGDQPPPGTVEPKRPVPTLAAVREAARDNPRLAAQKLLQIYRGPPPATGAPPGAGEEWANLLGRLSPDDDFVETWRMIVLKDAGVSHIVVPLGPAPRAWPDVIADIGQTGGPLAAKVACIRLNFAPGPDSPWSPPSPPERKQPAPG